MKNSKKIIALTGGGTAGHVAPNIALLPALRRLDFEIHYIGGKKGVERDLALENKLPYHCVSTGKLRRYLSFANITDIFRVARGCVEALFILSKLKPALIFSKGGFVAVPVAYAARLLGIPIIIHESDLSPGLANRIVAPFASAICVSFEETFEKLKSYYNSEKTSKIFFTGLPVREEILKGDAKKGRALCGFSEEKPFLLVMGGSLGATAINELVWEALPELVKFYCVAHICGQKNFKKIDVPGYKIFEYLGEELPHIISAATLIVSRAGASSIFEFLALKKPNILIPLPLSQSRGDQIENARVFCEKGFSRTLSQEEATPIRLLSELNNLYANRENYIQAMQNKTTDAISNIIKIISDFI